MRFLVASVVLLILPACKEADNSGDGGGDQADAGAGDCPLNTSGRLAFSRQSGGTHSVLLRLGDGADPWDRQLGTFTAEAGGDAAVTQIMQIGARHIALAGRFVTEYDVDEAELADGLITLKPLSDLGQGFEAAGTGSEGFIVGMRGGDVYCASPLSGEVFILGQGPMPGCTVRGLTGNCTPAQGGAYAIEFLVDCGTGSQIYNVSKQPGADTPPDIIWSTGVLDEVHPMTSLAPDGLAATEGGTLYQTGMLGFTLVRKTRLCVDPGNPFNGSTISIAGLE